MNQHNPSPTISPTISDRCDEACALIEAGDYHAACAIQTEMELSTDFGAAYAAQIIQFKIFLALKSKPAAPVLWTMPVQGGVQ